MNKTTAKRREVEKKETEKKVRKKVSVKEESIHYGAEEAKRKKEREERACTFSKTCDEASMLLRRKIQSEISQELAK